MEQRLKHIENLDQANIYLDQIHERWLEDLKEYLLNRKQFKSPEIYIGQNTEIYAKIVDEKKQDAAERIPELEIII